MSVGTGTIGTGSFQGGSKERLYVLIEYFADSLEVIEIHGCLIPEALAEIAR